MSHWSELFPQVVGVCRCDYTKTHTHMQTQQLQPCLLLFTFSHSHPLALTGKLQALNCLQLKVTLLRGQFVKLNHNFLANLSFKMFVVPHMLTSDMAVGGELNGDVDWRSETTKDPGNLSFKSSEKRNFKTI